MISSVLYDPGHSAFPYPQGSSGERTGGTWKPCREASQQPEDETTEGLSAQRGDRRAARGVLTRLRAREGWHILVASQLLFCDTQRISVAASRPHCDGAKCCQKPRWDPQSCPALSSFPIHEQCPYPVPTALPPRVHFSLLELQVT